MKFFNFHRLLEFFLVGVVMGVAEDLIAISLATDKLIDFRVIVIAFFVALPFAIVSELVVDHNQFKEFMSRKFKRSP